MDSITQRKHRGYYVERKLVKLLSKKRGNYVFRVPVSGSRSSNTAITAFPDVFLINNIEDRIVAFEVKSTFKNRVKIRREQVIKLLKFLAPFKKYRSREAVIAVWFFKEGKWVFRRIRDVIGVGNYVTIKAEEESDWSL